MAYLSVWSLLDIKLPAVFSIRSAPAISIQIACVFVHAHICTQTSFSLVIRIWNYMTFMVCFQIFLQKDYQLTLSLAEYKYSFPHVSPKLNFNILSKHSPYFWLCLNCQFLDIISDTCWHRSYGVSILNSGYQVGCIISRCFQCVCVLPSF